jgi:membrane-bound serine protease (ClpP class)
VICLLLGFFALAVLPVNYAGLALIALALGLFVAEAFVASYGTLTLGGCICLILGALMLVESPGGFVQVSLWVAVPVAVATALITVFLVSRIVRTHRAPVQTGGEALAGKEIAAKEAFTASGDEYLGTVFLHGEYWRAASPKPVVAGQSVRVNHLKGLTLIVEPIERYDDRQPASKSQRPEQPIA